MNAYDVPVVMQPVRLPIQDWKRFATEVLEEEEPQK
jgi:hypothetical protein